MEKEELYKLNHNLWKMKTLVERAYDLSVKALENEENIPYLEIVLEEMSIGMIMNLKNEELSK